MHCENIFKYIIFSKQNIIRISNSTYIPLKQYERVKVEHDMEYHMRISDTIWDHRIYLFISQLKKILFIKFIH